MAIINGKVTKGHDDDAAWDLHAKWPKGDKRQVVESSIFPGRRETIPTGVHLELESDEVALVCSRSGLAAKYGVFVLNAPGVIDAGYKGEVQVILHNSDRVNAFWVKEGDRIAQLLILKLPEVARLTEVINIGTARGTNGLGSTGHGAA